MKEGGGELLDEGCLEVEDVEENNVNGGRGSRRGLRRIGKEARRGIYIVYWNSYEEACSWGIGWGSTPSTFLADLTAHPWGPICMLVPPNWGWCHCCNTTRGETHSSPEYQGGVRSRNCERLGA